MRVNIRLLRSRVCESEKIAVECCCPHCVVFASERAIGSGRILTGSWRFCEVSWHSCSRASRDCHGAIFGASVHPDSASRFKLSDRFVDYRADLCSEWAGERGKWRMQWLERSRNARLMVNARFVSFWFWFFRLCKHACWFMDVECCVNLWICSPLGIYEYAIQCDFMNVQIFVYMNIMYLWIYSVSCEFINIKYF